MKQRIWDWLFILEKNSIYASIKKGILLAYLIFLFGAVTRLVYILPGMEEGGFLLTWQNGLVPDLLELLSTATEARISLYLVIAISYYYAQTRNIQNSLLFLMTIMTSTIQFIIGTMAIGGDDYTSLFGVQGVFLAITTAIVTTYEFDWISRFLLKHRNITDIGSEDNIKIAWMSIFPMFSTLALGSFIYSCLINVAEHINCYDMLMNRLHIFFTNSGNELLNGLIYTFMINVSWFMGIHGSTALEPITTSYFLPATYDANAIVSRGFLEVFAQIGGGGCALAFAIALFFVKRARKEYKAHRWSIYATFFNVSEMIVFSYNIILNPIMFLPFVGVPMLATCIAYLATVMGFLPIINTYLVWAIPVGFSGVISTQSINGAIIQMLIIIISVIIYIPFVKLNLRFQEEKEAHILELLIKEFQAHEAAGITMPLLTRSDYAGQIAKNIVSKLRKDIANQSISIYYQPQHDVNDRMIGAEALLRWEYNRKVLYPPFVIALAREEGLNNGLTLATLDIVASSIQEIHVKTNDSIHISFNCVADQLDSSLFVRQMIDTIMSRGVADYMHIELTEETSLSGLYHIKNNIALLSSHGIQMAIDDFGMGHTSLNYLKENKFQYVKLDGALIKNLTSQPRSAEIISSIINLGEHLHYEVIAEYVETLEIKELLMELGCFIYQGYYYSPAIPKADLINYCIRQNSEA